MAARGYPRGMGRAAGIAIWFVLGLALAGPAQAALPPDTLVNSGRWLTDRDGRVVIQHGMAVNHFQPPHLPEATGFGADDARFLRRHGFRVVRVGFTWSGIEPEPGRIDRGYIRSLRRTIRLLADHGIHSMLDAHQDGYSTVTGTDGAPEWATITDGVPNLRIAFGVDYLANPAVLRAFDNLYANAPAPDGVGVADHYARFWRALARRFHDEPRFLGYELMNEPYPGSQYPLCANPLGCPAFDRKLSAFYRRVTKQIRAVDTDHVVFYEPNLFFDFGADTHLADPGGGDRRTGFAFHDYCLGAGAGDALPPIPGNGLACPIGETLVMRNAVRYARENGSALISTEWAATDDLAVTARVAGQLDDHRIPWTFWQYNSPRLVPDPERPPRGENLNRQALAVLDRPHPMAVAGTPGPWRWNADRRTFEFAYSTTSPGSGRDRRALTEIWTSPMHFPTGRHLAVKGARVAGRRDAAVLRLRNRPRVAEVRLRIAPR